MRMDLLTISSSNDFIELDGRPVFYLADTAWSVFSNASLDEWDEYLTYRRSQNFNVVQISILPILHDASESMLGLTPFKENPDGSWNFSEIDVEFFNRAEKMVTLAKEKGFIPALVVLWCNYVPDTWASVRNPGYVMPYDTVETYTRFIGQTFGKYNPIFIVSGDTRFESDRVLEYYRTALKIIKQVCPYSLTTLHLAPNEELPNEFVNSPALDFYMYQAGHHYEQQDNSHKLAHYFYRLPVKRPIIDGEPCYEGHGYGFRYGRYGESDIRKATWQSLLAGAKAGITYGAHGVWSWHKRGTSFTSESFSGAPFEWRTALKFPGAWDVSFAKWLFEQYGLFYIEPRNDLLLNESPEIRLAMGRGRVVIYCPFTTEIRINAEFPGYDFTLINLSERLIARPEVSIRNGQTFISMHPFNSDVLVIGVDISL